MNNKRAIPLLSIAFLSCLYLLLPAISLAANNAQLNSQRLIFKQAQKALQTNQIGQFKKLNTQLNDYPLQAYLDYLYLRHRLNHTDSQTISQFINTNKGTFYATRLHSHWLKRLVRNKKWSLFLTHYKASSSASQQCFRLQALISTGKGQQALDETAPLWLVPKSQDKACDPVFKYWHSKGQPTDKLRWQRIILALEGNQFNLAQYLAKSLSNPTQANRLIALWRQAHYSPSALLKKIPSKKGELLSQNTAITRQIIQHSIQRLARKSTDKAFEAWQRIQPTYHFSEQEKLTTQRYIANRAALNREDRTLEFFADIPAETWRVRAALWQQDWQAAQKAILDLNLNVQETPRWQYWLARSRAELGDQDAANQGYQSLLMERDFYSFLAADKLQQPYQMNHNPLSFTQEELDSFSQQPAVARLKEFYALNMNLEARRQAYSLKQSSSVRQLQLLATLTHQWGWHNQTIAFLGKAKYWDALDLRFPIVYDTAILKAGKKNGLNPSWLFGIARQESAFNPSARSHVGATGLMQLMPKTGQLIARLINHPLKSTSELLNPDRNIQLGSAYLRRMYDKNQRNPVLATASYNAGPHRIKRWLPTHDLAADIWIENIPYTETRRYTQSVLSYATIFDYQRKQEIKPLSDRMPVIKAQIP